MLLDLLVRNWRYCARSPISPYSKTIHGGSSAVHTPNTRHIFGSVSPAKNLTSLRDSMDPEAASPFARSAFTVLTATILPTPEIIFSSPSVSNKLIWKL